MLSVEVREPLAACVNGRTSQRPALGVATIEGDPVAGL